MKINFFWKILPVFVLFLIPTTGQAQVTNRITGRLVKSASSTAVYQVGLDGKRHAFPNSKIYFTWYEDFSQVETILAEELSAFPLGKNVRYRPGTRLIKVQSVSEVYAVEPFGDLRNIASEAVAIELYGSDWAKLVDDIDISFFFDYNIRGVIDFSGDHVVYPVGSLLRVGTLSYLVDRRNDGNILLRPISGLAFDLNNFEGLPIYEFTNNTIPASYRFGVPLFTAETTISCVSCSRAFNGRSAWISVITRQSQDALYSLDIPPNWEAEFITPPTTGTDTLLEQVQAVAADDLSPQQVQAAAAETVIRVFEVDAKSQPTGRASLTIQKYTKIDQPILTEFITSDLRPIANLVAQEGLLYDSLSMYDQTAYDLVYSADAFYWSHIVETNDAFYELVFKNEHTYFGSYVDTFDLMLKSFKVTPPPPPAPLPPVEEPAV